MTLRSDSSATTFTTSTSTSCTATASSSTANLGPGYDVFGLGLDAFEDRVKITTMKKKTMVSNRSKKRQITIKMSDEKSGKQGGGEVGGIIIPTNPEDNSAGLVVKRMAEDFHIEYDLDINILKKVTSWIWNGK